MRLKIALIYILYLIQIEKKRMLGVKKRCLFSPLKPDKYLKNFNFFLISSFPTDWRSFDLEMGSLHGFLLPRFEVEYHLKIYGSNSREGFSLYRYIYRWLTQQIQFEERKTVSFSTFTNFMIAAHLRDLRKPKDSLFDNQSRSWWERSEINHHFLQIQMKALLQLIVFKHVQVWCWFKSS